MAVRKRKPTPVRIDGRDFLTTAQVADYLGIRVESVYAYVSRGTLHRTAIRGRRGSFFPLAQIEELARRGRQPRVVGATNRIHTQITLIDTADVLRYRGRDVVGLVESGWGFEQICALLWDRDPALPFVAPPEVMSAALRAAEVMPPSARPHDLLKVAVDLAGAADPQAHDLRAAAVIRTGTHLLATIAEVLGSDVGAVRPAQPLHPMEPIATRVCRALGGGESPTAARLIDATLCLLADHDLATSTAAVRVAASARANPYAAVAAGLGALDSPLHGTASRPAYRLLGELTEEPDRVLAEVRIALGARGELPAGFGHRVYQERDPRADLLLRLLRQTRPGHPVLNAVDQLRAAVEPWPHAFANIDLASAALTHALDLNRDSGDLLFAIARTAGWIAHLLEEYEAEPLRFRMIGVYAGVRPDH